MPHPRSLHSRTPLVEGNEDPGYDGASPEPPIHLVSGKIVGLHDMTFKMTG